MSRFRGLHPRILWLAPVLAMTACAAGPVPAPRDLPAPAEVGPERTWETYGSGHARPEPSAAWRGRTAWSHPPEGRKYSSMALPPPSQPVPAAASSALAKPRDSRDPRAAAAAGPPSAVQAPQPGDGSAPDAAPVSEWTAMHVPEAFRAAYAAAVSEAAIRGTAKAVEPATGNVFAISSTGKSGGCVALEVIILSPEGKLPIVSRGHAERCG